MTAGDWSSRLAGALLVVVGVLNLAFGVLSWLTEQVQLSTGVAGGLVTAGLVTAALGTLVWRGSRLATIIALTVFAMLLVFQLSELMAEAGDTADGLAGEHLTRFGVLGVVVAALAVAAWRRRKRAPAPTPR